MTGAPAVAPGWAHEERERERERDDSGSEGTVDGVWASTKGDRNTDAMIATITHPLGSLVMVLLRF
ncbi:MAG: hypothetical protein HYY11_03530 [Candidatus Methylomirabilis oxyfera]|nr:hypothetical protein [Candidatus Methylomirabilis oxyfera]